MVYHKMLDNNATLFYEQSRPTGLSVILFRIDQMTLRESIIHESLKLFSLNGFNGTSIHDIIDACHTSKGGFYNHFSSKEDLFLHVLNTARKIWREKNLYGLDETGSPIEKIKKLLVNFKDRYLKDSENFPGGCIFITFAVELDVQRPHLSKEVNKGFLGFKAMIKRLLDEGAKAGYLKSEVDTQAVTDLLFAGILGTTVVYRVDKSSNSLDAAVNALIGYLDSLILRN